jgi:glycerol uptake facilitator-like aquaporin
MSVQSWPSLGYAWVSVVGPLPGAELASVIYLAFVGIALALTDFEEARLKIDLPYLG